MKKRLDKKITKQFLSRLIASDESGTFVVVWSYSWRFALTATQLINFKKTFRQRCCTARNRSYLSAHVGAVISEKELEFYGPVHPLPVRKLPPQRVLLCD